MRYDTSLLKVLEIWKDTFEESRGKLTQSQVNAFLVNIETKKLSYYSEEALRLGMKLAFSQNTSKLKDIYRLVFRADEQLRESALKKAEERIAKKKAEEPNVLKTLLENMSSYFKTRNTVAWLLKWKNNKFDLENAENIIFKLFQNKWC